MTSSSTVLTFPQPTPEPEHRITSALVRALVCAVRSGDEQLAAELCWSVPILWEGQEPLCTVNVCRPDYEGPAVTATLGGGGFVRPSR